jgi:hypothetical protein
MLLFRFEHFGFKCNGPLRILDRDGCERCKPLEKICLVTAERTWMACGHFQYPQNAVARGQGRTQHGEFAPIEGGAFYDFVVVQQFGEFD